MDPVPRKRDATQSEIREILDKRRETLSRVRADLEKVEKLQRDFKDAAKDQRPMTDEQNS